jgi:hypothetical protein
VLNQLQELLLQDQLQKTLANNMSMLEVLKKIHNVLTKLLWTLESDKRAKRIIKSKLKK